VRWWWRRRRCSSYAQTWDRSTRTTITLVDYYSSG
jgi:hypothetical protein